MAKGIKIRLAKTDPDDNKDNVNNISYDFSWKISKYDAIFGKKLSKCKVDAMEMGGKIEI